MNPDDLNQRLAAILAADGAGYSRLMARDERATLAALETARESFRKAVAAQHGRVVDMAGDSVLAIFETATAAVGAALAVQAALETAVSGAPGSADERLRFRIGVHLGEVIEKHDGTVYGDGVNIAARLQAMAEPGGIVVSDSVRGAVGGRLGVGFDDLGAREVKNIADPVHAFRALAGGALPAAIGPRRRAWTGIGSFGWIGLAAALAVVATALWAVAARPWAGATANASTPERSVAVMPFVAGGSDTADTALADALTLSITNELSRLPRTTVAAPGRARALQRQGADTRQVGRELHVRYLVEGEVTPHGDRTVVSARLLDAESTRQTWGREFELARTATDDQRSLLQLRVTRRTIDALAGAERERSARQPDASTPMDLVYRGGSVWGNDYNTGWRAASAYFDRALQMDPDHVEAMLARTMSLDMERNINPGEPKPQLVAEMEALTARAIALEPGNPWAWFWRSWPLLHLQRWGEAFAAIDIAIALAPYEPHHIAQRANLLQLMGRQSEAETLLLRAIEMDPPGSQFMQRTLCGTRLLMGRYDDAAALCEQAAARIRWFEDQMLLTAIHAQRGDMAKAAIARAELLKQQPGATIANNLYLRISSEPAFRQQVEQHLLAGLRKAGIPER